MGSSHSPVVSAFRRITHCCCLGAAGGWGNTLHSGHPITTVLRVSFNFSRRAAISAWNCSSVRNTRLPRSMNMLATERLPDPCQLRGSGTFLFDGELSI